MKRSEHGLLLGVGRIAAVCRKKKMVENPGIRESQLDGESWIRVRRHEFLIERAAIDHMQRLGHAGRTRSFRGIAKYARRPAKGRQKLRLHLRIRQLERTCAGCIPAELGRNAG